jgi:hypothetical protein
MRDNNPAALFTYVAEQLNRFGLAYLHIIEPRVGGNVTIDTGQVRSLPSNFGKFSRGRSSLRVASSPKPQRPPSRTASPIPWHSDITSWQIPICRSASRKALRSRRMTEIPSTPST